MACDCDVISIFPQETQACAMCLILATAPNQQVHVHVHVHVDTAVTGMKADPKSVHVHFSLSLSLIHPRLLAGRQRCSSNMVESHILCSPPLLGRPIRSLEALLCMPRPLIWQVHHSRLDNVHMYMQQTTISISVVLCRHPLGSLPPPPLFPRHTEVPTVPKVRLP